MSLAGLALAAAVIAAKPAYSAETVETLARLSPGSTRTIDHTAWSKLLTTYVVAGPDGINRVAYTKWKKEAHGELKRYVTTLEAVDPTTLDRAEQFAYWANLYNAKTIDIVLDKHPVASIKDISLGGTLFSLVTGGPWKAKVVTVKGLALSLDDIEHQILRPKFADPRVHYSVNCASIGCPNLPTVAFTGATLEAMLDAGARAYVNHPRGIRVDGAKITASSIYSWFQADFGGSAKGVLDHVRKYATPELAAKLGSASAIAEFDYDWRLNEAKL